MKGMPGLVAVVLDDSTAAMLRKWAVHQNVHCKHVTMAYRPSPDVYAKYAPMMGQNVEFDIVSADLDSCGQAVVVSGVPSEKDVPHITVSCGEGVKPSYSNTLLSKSGRHSEALTPGSFRGRGVVQYVPL